MLRHFIASAIFVVLAVSVFIPSSSLVYAQVTAVADNFPVLEGATLTDSVATNDTSSVPNPIQYSIPGGTPVLQVTVPGSSTGILTLAPDFASTGNFTYEAPTDVVAPGYGVFFEYSAFDGDGGVVTQTVTFNLIANQVPVATDDVYNTNEDTALVVPAAGVLANDTDPDSGPNPLTVSVDTTTTNGTLVLNGDGSFTYTPDANYNGSDSFTYTVTDGQDTASATVNITVDPVNDAPTGVADAYSTDEDVLLTVPATGVLANDSDIDGDSITATIDTTTTNGTLVLNGDGSFTYTPDADFSGSDSFTYTVTDGTLTSAPVTVNITVNSVNDLPVAVDDGPFVIDEDTVLDIPVASYLGNDSDPDGDTLTISSVTQPSNGFAEINPDNTISYYPNVDYNGTDSFTYTISDGNGGTATATISITINPLNDAPIVIFDTFGDVVNEGDVIIVSGLIIDPDGDAVPTAQFYPADETGFYTDFVPDATATPGVYTFSFLRTIVDDNPSGTPFDRIYPLVNATDINGNTGTGTTYFDLANVAPVITSSVAPAANVNINTPVNLDISFTDPGVDDTKFFLVNWGDGTSTNLQIDPDFVTTDYLNQVFSHSYTTPGTYTITVNLSDDDLGQTVVTYSVTVVDPNQAPVAVNDAYSTSKNVVLNVSAANGILSNDTDPDGTVLTIAATLNDSSEVSPSALSASIIGNTVNGSIVLQADGSFVYTPNNNFVGVDTFTYSVSDGALFSQVATVTITVNDVAPAAVNSPVLSQTGDELNSSMLATAIVVSLAGIAGVFAPRNKKRMN